LILLVAVATLCMGCPRLGICVKVPSKQASSLVIEVAEGDDCNRPARVTDLEVRRVSGDKTFWTISSSEGVELTTIRYGEVPPGFNQGLAAQPLPPGERVNISVTGRGISGGVDVTITP
jgi:hypothetical protein